MPDCPHTYTSSYKLVSHKLMVTQNLSAELKNIVKLKLFQASVTFK